MRDRFITEISPFTECAIFSEVATRSLMFDVSNSVLHVYIMSPDRLHSDRLPSIVSISPSHLEPSEKYRNGHGSFIIIKYTRTEVSSSLKFWKYMFMMLNRNLRTALLIQILLRRLCTFNAGSSGCSTSKS